jgi:hypothetical protein
MDAAREPRTPLRLRVATVPIVAALRWVKALKLSRSAGLAAHVALSGHFNEWKRFAIR